VHLQASLEDAIAGRKAQLQAVADQLQGQYDAANKQASGNLKPPTFPHRIVGLLFVFICSKIASWSSSTLVSPWLAGGRGSKLRILAGHD